ncbi:unnamed protein product, partial [Sphacelaria rigidula]
AGSAVNDRSVLCGFYDTSGGPEWLENWKTAEDLSRWTGVTVNAEGRVIKLHLSGGRLTGRPLLL